MLVKKISFPSKLEDGRGPERENIDVFVELEEEEGAYPYTYTLVVATPRNIEYLMEKDKLNYSEPGHPFLIVKKFTREIIAEAIEAYAAEDDGYWLKLYQFAEDIDTAVFEKLKAEHIEELKESDEYLEELD